jgi:hypothetical protein
MCVPIEFDYETRTQANKVADVLADGVLAPKLEAVQLPAAQKPPHELLGRVGISAQISRAFCVDRISSHSGDDHPRARFSEQDLHRCSP